MRRLVYDVLSIEQNVEEFPVLLNRQFSTRLGGAQLFPHPRSNLRKNTLAHENSNHLPAHSKIEVLELEEETSLS